MGNAGALLTEVICIKPGKDRHFAIVDAAMNDLIRPALYQGWHDIWQCHQGHPAHQKAYDIVGPVCESADFLGRNRLLSISPQSLLAICHTGAYVSCMASNYNSRPRLPEVLVDQASMTLIKPRETLDDMLNGEQQCLKHLD